MTLKKIPKEFYTKFTKDELFEIKAIFNKFITAGENKKAETYLKVVKEKKESPLNLRKLINITQNEYTSYAKKKDILNFKIDYILIANRGEIAFRMLKEAHALSKKVIILYEENDLSWDEFLKKDDIAIQIRSYCDRGKKTEDRYDVQDMWKVRLIIENQNIELSKVAVFSGYGFNSEDEKWIKAVEDLGFRICGPSSDSIHAFGLKTQANAVAKESKLFPPLTSGSIYHIDAMSTAEKEQNLAKAIAFYEDYKGVITSFLLKDARGGGGSGQFKIDNPTREEFETALINFAEKKEIVEFSVDEFIVGTRHIEFQVVSDWDGNVGIVGIRDCSEQLQMQKIEEEVANQIPLEYCEKFKTAIVKFFKRLEEKIGHPYVGLATVETMYKPSAVKNHFRFLEVNPRPQVELPVTEMQSGFNLISSLIDIVEGKKIRSQSDIEKEDIGGTTIEVRLTLQDVFDEEMIKFMRIQGRNKILYPTAGVFDVFSLPENEQNTIIHKDPRLKKGVYVSGKYDPMIAKVVIHKDLKYDETIRQNRLSTISDIKKVIKKIKIKGKGLNTNKRILLDILDHDIFLNRNHRSETVAPSVVANIRAENLERAIRDKYNPYNFSDNLTKMFCIAKLGALTNSQVKIFESFTIGYGKFLTVVENRVRREISKIKRDLGFDDLQKRLMIWLQNHMEEGEKCYIFKNHIQKNIVSTHFRFHPFFFPFFELFIMALGLKPEEAILNYEDRKLTSVIMQDDNESYDLLYIQRFVDTEKGRSDLKDMVSVKRLYRKDKFKLRDAEVLKAIANKVFNSDNKEKKTNGELLQEMFPDTTFKNGFLSLDKGQVKIFKHIFYCLTKIRFKTCFKEV